MSVTVSLVVTDMSGLDAGATSADDGSAVFVMVGGVFTETPGRKTTSARTHRVAATNAETRPNRTLLK
jgi:hypothetical protein